MAFFVTVYLVKKYLRWCLLNKQKSAYPSVKFLKFYGYAKKLYDSSQRNFIPMKTSPWLWTAAISVFTFYLKWTDETIQITTVFMHITFYNSQWFLVETGTILLNYSRLSICQMFLVFETLL